MTANVEATEELLQSLWSAQLTHTKALIEEAVERGGTGDDGHDYLDAALDLAQTMEMLRFDTILEGRGSLSHMLNWPLPAFDDDHTLYYAEKEVFQKDSGFAHLADLACDGIANEFYELNCPALPKED